MNNQITSSAYQFGGYQLTGGGHRGCCYQYVLTKISTGERFFFEISDRKIQSFGDCQLFSQEEYSKEYSDFHFRNIDVMTKLGINMSMKTIKILGISEMDGCPVIKHKECSYHHYGAKDKQQIFFCLIDSKHPFSEQ